MGKTSEKNKRKLKYAVKAVKTSFCNISPIPIQGCPCPKRSISTITIKRKNIHPQADDKYGHWWFEIDGKESYGWWPKKAVGLSETLGGTDGELNGQTTFGGPSTQDPHQGDSADEEFNPMTSNGDCRTDGEIKDCLRSFANTYSGEWRWTVGWGQNSHTFQDAAMKHCRIFKP